MVGSLFVFLVRFVHQTCLHICFSVGSLQDVFGMVASATDALSESVHGMALALYGFRWDELWALGGAFGVHFEGPRLPKVVFGALWGPF